jgi:UDPglucose 6-dehydrogenase
VVVKSTTTPLGIFYLVDRWHRLKFVANPEFLTQRQARVDFVRSPLIILGGTTPEVTVVEAFYRQYWPDSKYLILSAPGAMMVKYMLNTFFATKVIFLNEMYQLWKRLNLKDNWESLIEGFVSDSRVGTSHSSVPGPDGDFGFGGACFPKDLRAITQDAIFIGSEHEVLEAVWRANTILRQVEDWK